MKKTMIVEIEKYYTLVSLSITSKRSTVGRDVRTIGDDAAGSIRRRSCGSCALVGRCGIGGSGLGLSDCECCVCER